MGLLDDVLNSDQGRLGLGLLAAAGPRADGAGFGQRVLEGVGSLDAWRQSKTKSDLVKMQMDNLKSEIEQRALAMQQQQKLQAIYERLIGGGGPAQGGTGLVPSPSVQAPGMGGGTGITGGGQGMQATPASASPFASSGGGMLDNMGPNDLAAIQLLGGKDLTNVWKIAHEGVERKPGSIYEMPNGTQKYIPNVKDGTDFDPVSKRVSLLPGYLESQGAISDRTEESKSKYDLVTVKVSEMSPVTGRMTEREVQVPRDVAVSMQRSAYSPQKPVLSVPNLKNSDGQSLSPDLQRVIAEDAATNGVTNPVVNLSGPKKGNNIEWQLGTPTLQVPSLTPARFGVGLTQEEKANNELEQQRQKTMADNSSREGVNRIYTGYDTAKAAVDALTGLNESRNAIRGGVFAGGGAETKLAISKGLQAIGFNIDPDKVSNTDYLQSQLGQGILAKAKTLGANPTDNDARIIRDIVGSIGTDPRALDKLIDYQEQMYRRAIDTHNKNYESAKNGGFQSTYDLTITPPEFGTPKNEPKTFDLLPDAKQYPGKRVMAPDGKTVYRSNGKIWIKE